MYLPQDIAIAHTATEATVTATLPEDLFYFKGHFPRAALLPGVIQLEYVLHFYNSIFQEQKSVHDVKSMKFVHPLLPRDQILLKLKRSGENLEFSYYTLREGQEQLAAKGQIQLW